MRISELPDEYRPHTTFDKVFRPKSRRVVSAIAELNRLRQQLADMHVLFRMAERVKGCGCCGDHEGSWEVYNVVQKMNIAGDHYINGELDLAKWNAVVTNFAELRERMGVPSYDAEMYDDE